ncbi:unnamed protein product, partial [Trichogramma brassicae]
MRGQRSEARVCILCLQPRQHSFSSLTTFTDRPCIVDDDCESYSATTHVWVVRGGQKVDIKKILKITLRILFEFSNEKLHQSIQVDLCMFIYTKQLQQQQQQQLHVLCFPFHQRTCIHTRSVTFHFAAREMSSNTQGERDRITPEYSKITRNERGVKNNTESKKRRYGSLPRQYLGICIYTPTRNARFRRTPGLPPPRAGALAALAAFSAAATALCRVAKLITSRNNEQFNNDVGYKDKSVTRQKGFDRHNYASGTKVLRSYNWLCKFLRLPAHVFLCSLLSVVDIYAFSQSYIERIVHAYREASLSHVAYMRSVASRCAAAAKKPSSEENFLEHQQQQQKLFFLDSRLAGLVFQTFKSLQQQRQWEQIEITRISSRMIYAWCTRKDMKLLYALQLPECLYLIYLVPIESEHLQSSVKRLIIRSSSSLTDLILCQVEDPYTYTYTGSRRTNSAFIRICDTRGFLSRVAPRRVPPLEARSTESDRAHNVIITAARARCGFNTCARRARIYVERYNNSRESYSIEFLCEIKVSRNYTSATRDPDIVGSQLLSRSTRYTPAVSCYINIYDTRGPETIMAIGIRPRYKPTKYSLYFFVESPARAAPARMHMQQRRRAV